MRSCNACGQPLEPTLETCEICGAPAPTPRRRKPAASSPGRTLLRGLLALLFAAGVFIALLRSSQELPSALVRSPHEAEDRKAAEHAFAGRAGIYGAVRIPDEFAASRPQKGQLIIRATRATLAAGQAVAQRALPLPTELRTLFHLRPQDALVPDAFAHPVNLSAHWVQNGSVENKAPGDLWGECATNPIQPGEQLAIIVLGTQVGKNDPMKWY